MTEKDDLRARLYELHVGMDDHRATARQIRSMIQDGDLAGATTALDDLETALHPALAVGGGSSSFIVASKTLTAAQVLDLDNTPVELISAPAGRRYIWPVAMLGHYRFGTVPYTTTVDGAYLWVGWDTAQQFTITMQTDLMLDQSEDIYNGFDMRPLSVISNNRLPASMIEGTPLLIWGTGDAATTFPSPEWLTNGDGSLTIRIWYSIIDGAPPA